MENNHQHYKNQLLETMTRLGFKPGDLQFKWRTEKNLTRNYMEIETAILDALVNMGGATAWSGDGSSCAVQIVQNIMAERDALKARVVELEQREEELLECLNDSVIRPVGLVIEELETRFPGLMVCFRHSGVPINRPAPEPGEFK